MSLCFLWAKEMFILKKLIEQLLFAMPCVEDRKGEQNWILYPKELIV